MDENNNEINPIEGEEVQSTNVNEQNTESTAQQPSTNSDTIYEASAYNPTNVQSQENSEEANNGLSIASMVCGILSIVLCCLRLSFVLAIVAIVLSVIGKKKSDESGKKMATAGLVCGIVALVIKVLIVLFAITVFSSIKATIDTPETMEGLQELFESMQVNT